MTLEHLDTIISFVVILTGVSLLITTLTQMVSALLGLRGSNLRWGIETLLKELDPKLQAHAEEIAQKVLHHPLISDSTLSGFNFWLTKRWKLASAVRKDELITILRMLASQNSGPATKNDSGAWRDALIQSLQVLDKDDVEKIQRAAPEIQKLLPGDPDKANEIIHQVTSTAEQLSGKINQWFDSVMDRVSQRFVVHTRLWTVIFALSIALGLHLDTFRLVKQLSTDADLRNRLVSSSDALLKKADDILVTSPAGSTDYVASMQQLINDHPVELKGMKKPSGFTNLADGEKWLDSQLVALKKTNLSPERDSSKSAMVDIMPDSSGGTDSVKSVGHLPGIVGVTELNNSRKMNDSIRSRWHKEYESLVPQAALRSAAAKFESALAENKFELIPNPYPLLDTYWTPDLMHLWGTLTTALLLSLGAPFWFNILKSLTNLRPVVAGKQEKEAIQEKSDAAPAA